jgi:hypothetical protein
MAQTEVIRREIPLLLSRLASKSIFDAPCGDFYWMKAVQFEDVKYIGGDIVKSLVDRLNHEFASDKRAFITCDITRDPLPAADVMLSRDCLVHLPYQSIKQFIANLKKSEIKYLLTTTFPGRDNRDIKMGNWRPLDLQKAPFFFPTPLDLINENCTQGNGMYKDKSLGLWSVKDLPVF